MTGGGHVGGPVRFQLNDGGGQAGDVGVIPNRWKGDGQMPGPGYGLGGNMPGDQEQNNVHYGPVPTKVLRRNRTQKKVK
jgi:chitin synthase